MPRLVVTITALILSFAASANAHAAVLDFEALEQNNALKNVIAATYSEDGYTLTQGPNEGWLFTTFGTQATRYYGSTALFNNTQDGVTTLTKDDGSSFTVLSIDLAELIGVQAGGVTFTGAKVGGGTVTQTFNLDGLLAFQTFSFTSAFTNLVSLTWIQSAPYHQFDNIVLLQDTVETPIPAALPMFLAGLFGFRWIAQRKVKAVR